MQTEVRSPSGRLPFPGRLEAGAALDHGLESRTFSTGCQYGGPEQRILAAECSVLVCSLVDRSSGSSRANPCNSPLNRAQVLTLGAIGLLIVAVILGGVHIGMAAFAAAVLLGLADAAYQEEAIRKMPWGTIMLVSGVTVLIHLLELTSGMDLFVDMLASITSRATIIPFLAATVGLISAYSSTSGVVLPAFLPIVPGLNESLGGGMAEALAMTMNVGGHLVDVSPLSTIGALCVADVASGKASRKLFNQMLAWGLSMTVAGAVICMILFG